MKKKKEIFTKGPQTKAEIKKELEGWLTGYDASHEKRPGGEDYKPGRRSSSVKSYNLDEMLPKTSGKKKETKKKDNTIYDDPEVKKLKGPAYFKEIKRLEALEKAKLKNEAATVKKNATLKKQFTQIDNSKNYGIGKINIKENKFLERYEKKVDNLSDRIERSKREKTITNLNKKVLKEVENMQNRVANFDNEKNRIIKKSELKKAIVLV